MVATLICDQNLVETKPELKCKYERSLLLPLSSGRQVYILPCPCQSWGSASSTAPLSCICHQKHLKPGTACLTPSLDTSARCADTVCSSSWFAGYLKIGFQVWPVGLCRTCTILKVVNKPNRTSLIRPARAFSHTGKEKDKVQENSGIMWQ